MSISGYVRGSALTSGIEPIRRRCAAVVDVGGSKIRMARIDFPDIIHELVVFERDELGADLEPVLEQLRLWAIQPLDRVVIAVPGVVDYVTSTPDSSNVMPSAWRQQFAAAPVAELTKAPTWVLNDVDLAAIAVSHRRDHRPDETLLYVNLGSGIGAAVVHDHTLVRGRRSLELADLHLGSTPAATSAVNLMRLASANGVRRECPAQITHAAAARRDRAPDHAECEPGVCLVVLDHLAVGVATLQRIFGVQTVVVGGSRGRPAKVIERLRAGLPSSLEVTGTDIDEPALLGAWFVGAALAPRPGLPVVPALSSISSPPANRMETDAMPTDIIEQLRTILAEVTALEDPAGVGPDEDLYDLGLASLETIRILLQIEERFHVEVPDEILSQELFRTLHRMTATVADLRLTLRADGR